MTPDQILDAAADLLEPLLPLFYNVGITNTGYSIEFDRDVFNKADALLSSKELPEVKNVIRTLREVAEGLRSREMFARECEEIIAGLQPLDTDDANLRDWEAERKD